MSCASSMWTVVHQVPLSMNVVCLVFCLVVGHLSEHLCLNWNSSKSCNYSLALILVIFFFSHVGDQTPVTPQAQCSTVAMVSSTPSSPVTQQRSPRGRLVVVESPTVDTPSPIAGGAHRTEAEKWDDIAAMSTPGTVIVYPYIVNRYEYVHTLAYQVRRWAFQRLPSKCLI